jgi:hypothetical protein
MSQNTDPNMDQQNNQQTQQTQTGALSTTAPAFTSFGGGGNTLMPDVKLPPRKVAQNKQLGEGVVVNPKTDFPKEGYIGQNLVDSTGRIARGQYSEDEAYSLMAKLSSSERRQFQNGIASLGAYGSRKPSRDGLQDIDLAAVRDVMRVANAEGVTLDVATALIATKYGGLGQGAGGGQRIRTTPKQDLSAVFRRVSGELLGRRLSDAEINKFVKAYNRMETAEATGGAIAPSVEGAAIAQIEARQPEEASAMGLLQLTNIIDDSIKGLG